MKRLIVFATVFHAVAFAHPAALDLSHKITKKATISEPRKAAKPIMASDIEDLILRDSDDQVVFFAGKTKQSDTTTKNVNYIEKLIDGVKFYEGFHSRPYICPGGVRTIGYGFTGTYAKRKSIDKKTADRILREEIKNHIAIVRNNVKVKLTPHQEMALASFTFNCGEGALKKLVNGKGRLNDGNYKSIEVLLPQYRKANNRVLKGLVNRRQWELKFWKGLV